MKTHPIRPLVLVTAMLSLPSSMALAASWSVAFASPAIAPVIQSPSPWNVEVVQTTANLSQRLARLPDLQFTTAQIPSVPVIHVNAQVRYQLMKGVGAALTDSSAWLIYDTLPASSRAELMNALYGPGGIHLDWALVPIGASDFTANGRPYTYDDVPAGHSDPQLERFSIGHDDAYILPLLRQMLAINPQTEIFAVPWSAPAWMKANQALDNIGHKGTLLPSAYQGFADYFVKFIQGYAAQGVPIADIAPENEPNAPPPYPGMELPEQTQAQWIASNLAPALQAASLHTKIYGADVAWGNLSYAQALISSQAKSALSGIAWHCYGTAPGNMTTLHQLAPALDQLVTECSPGLTPLSATEVLIASIRNYASAATLWNLALNPSGGPVQPPNTGCGGCRGVVTVNGKTGSVSYGIEYYQLGQLSRFVQPGARRIDSEHFVSYGSKGATAGLDDVAFLNPDGSTALLAYNNASTATRFAVSWGGRSFTYTLASKATITFVWNLPTSQSQPAVAVNPKTDHQFVFWRGDDGYIHESWYDGTRWRGPATLESWDATVAAPSVGVGENGNQYVFWVGSDDDIYEAWYRSGAWSGPWDMTTRYGWGHATSAPGVGVTPRTNHQYVFWRNTDGDIHEAWYDGRWRGPRDMGWTPASAPSVAVSNNDRQYVVWESANGDIWEASHTTRWLGPLDMTTTHKWGQATSAPSLAVNPAADKQHVFWLDAAGDIDEAYTDNSGWHGPTDMTKTYKWAPSVSPVAVAIAEDRSQYVFWRGVNANIWEAYSYGKWTGSHDLHWS